MRCLQFVSFTNDEMAQYLVQSEWDERKHKSLQRNIKTEKFRFAADVNGIDCNEKRELDKKLNRTIVYL